MWLIITFLSRYKAKVVNLSIYYKAISETYAKKSKPSYDDKFYSLNVNNTYKLVFHLSD